MRFRNLRAEELEGSVDIAGLDGWLRTVGATDTTVLIFAPAGTGKAAAVGRLAHRLGRDVLLCNLMELFDHEDPLRQLDNLLRLCEGQHGSVIYLDKLDKALAQADRQPGSSALAEHLTDWLRSHREHLLSAECTVVFTGRSPEAIPDSLQGQIDKSLLA